MGGHFASTSAVLLLFSGFLGVVLMHVLALGLLPLLGA